MKEKFYRNMHTKEELNSFTCRKDVTISREVTLNSQCTFYRLKKAHTFEVLCNIRDTRWQKTLPQMTKLDINSHQDLNAANHNSDSCMSAVTGVKLSAYHATNVLLLAKQSFYC